MSGPTTAVYETAIGDALIGAAGLSAVMLAARAIKEAHDMHAEYGEAYKRVSERETTRNRQRKQLQEAKCQHIAKLHRQADQWQARLARMQGLLQEQQGEASSLQDVLNRPVAQDERSWNEYLGKLETAVKKLEAQISASGGISAQAMAELSSDQPDSNQLLTTYAQRYALRSSLKAEELAHYKELSRHLLSRLELATGEPLPIRIESLAREMLHAHDTGRAEALASDLRLEIQRANQQRKQQLADVEEATLLLSQLTDELPEELRIALEQVAAGIRLLDEPTRAITKAALEEFKAARQREEQEAIALVLEQSLRDLGYEVDDIGQTLFVSGGMVHFQKQAWQNYHVRMRVNTAEKSVNFNVVRAQSSGDAAQDKRLDYLAEDRWCAEFPALLKTLEARGVKLNVTRLLQAGEVPVQVVDAATLPVARTEEARHKTATAKQMSLGDKR
ncbi:MAG: hypothetical protein OEV15_04815 [Gallionella sp.]|nr:hypothetical protein [Gallionella sp.]